MSSTNIKLKEKIKRLNGLLNTQAIVMKEVNRQIAEKNERITALEKTEKEVFSRREQIQDINQCSHLLLSNRGTIRPRIMWSMIADINNRTTD